MQQIKFFNKEDKEKIIEFNKVVHDEGVVLAINNIMFNNLFKVLFPLGDPYFWDLEMSDELE